MINNLAGLRPHCLKANIEAVRKWIFRRPRCFACCFRRKRRLFVTCLLHQHNGFFLIAACNGYVDNVLLEFAPFGHFRVGVDFRVGGVFVVQVGKQVLRFAAAQPFDEFLGLGGFFGVLGYACTGYVNVRAFALLVGEEDADGQVGLFVHQAAVGRAFMPDFCLNTAPVSAT